MKLSIVMRGLLVMVEKIAINEFGEGNCCPECNSLKISVDYQFPLEVEIDLNTHKEIIKDCTGKRIYKPSNEILARRYKAAQMDAQLWIFSCRNCGWRSRTFTP